MSWLEHVGTWALDCFDALSNSAIFEAAATRQSLGVYCQQIVLSIQSTVRLILPDGAAALKSSMNGGSTLVGG